MTTKFDEIYDFFLPNIKDYSLVALYDQDPELYKEELKTILLSALPNSTLSSNKLNSLDIINSEFTVALDFTEKVILGKLMAIEYLTPFILDETITRETLNSKDYNTLNKGQHAQSLQRIKNELHVEVNRSLSRVSYTVENISSLFGDKS